MGDPLYDIIEPMLGREIDSIHLRMTILGRAKDEYKNLHASDGRIPVPHDDTLKAMINAHIGGWPSGW